MPYLFYSSLSQKDHNRSEILPDSTNLHCSILNDVIQCQTLTNPELALEVAIGYSVQYANLCPLPWPTPRFQYGSTCAQEQEEREAAQCHSGNHLHIEVQETACHRPAKP